MPYKHIRSRSRASVGSLKQLDEDCVEKYQSHFPWLRDRKFLTDLESDSVDSEILEEELSALQDEEPLSIRKKIAKCLQSHPVQVVLCVLVLLDASIVIAQILLDLHYFREKHHTCDDNMNKLLSYVRITHADELASYHGSNIDHILKLLQNEPDEHRGQKSTKHHHSSIRSDDQKHIIESSSNSGISTSSRGQSSFNSNNNKDDILIGEKKKKLMTGRQLEDKAKEGKEFSKRSTKPLEGESAEMLETNLYSDINDSDNNINSYLESDYSMYNNDDKSDLKTGQNEPVPIIRKPKSDDDIVDDSFTSFRKSYTLLLYKRRILSYSEYSDEEDEVLNTVEYEGDYVDSELRLSQEGSNRRHDDDPEEHHSSVDLLHTVAHSLHIASICILGFLVVEDLVKAVAMGREFCKHKVEVFDAVIIVSSFIVDLVFLGGMPGEEGEKAAAVLVVLLLWRIARVVDGIVITVKQKQEFRIRLQKRARRKTEKKIDALEEDRHYKTRQIQSLRDLCKKSGLQEEDIEACLPKKTKRTSSTASALTSVARLSVSMTMSMSSGLFSLVGDDNDKQDNDNSTPGCVGKSTDPLMATLARWKKDCSNTQEDGISIDLGSSGSSSLHKTHPHKTIRNMSLPDFRQRGLPPSPSRKDMLHSNSTNNSSTNSPSPCNIRRLGDYSPGPCSPRNSPSPSPSSKRISIVDYSPSGTKKEMLYASEEHHTIKEESPATSLTTSPVNASGIAIVIDSGSEAEEDSSDSNKCSIYISCDNIKGSDSAAGQDDNIKSCDNIDNNMMNRDNEADNRSSSKCNRFYLEGPVVNGCSLSSVADSDDQEGDRIIINVGGIKFDRNNSGNIGSSIDNIDRINTGGTGGDADSFLSTSDLSCSEGENVTDRRDSENSQSYLLGKSVHIV